MPIKSELKKSNPSKVRSRRRPPTQLKAKGPAVARPVTPPDPIREKVLAGPTLARVKAYSHGDGEEHPTAEIIEALFGCSPLPFLHAGNRVEIMHVSDSVETDLRHILVEEGMDMGVQIQRLGTYPPEELDFDIAKLRSRMTVFEKFGVSSVSALQFVDVPSEAGSQGFAVSVEARSFLFGKNARVTVERARQSHRARQTTTTEAEWFETKKEKRARRLLHDALKSVLRPPLARARLEEDGDSGVSAKKWKRGAAARAFTILQILSQLPLDKQMAAGGRGKQVLMPALQAAHQRVRLAAKHTTYPITRDGLVHHWFAERERLGLTGYSVPLVRLR